MKLVFIQERFLKVVIENSLISMIGQNVKSFYGFGDISLKSLKDFIEKNHINMTAD